MKRFWNRAQAIVLVALIAMTAGVDKAGAASAGVLLGEMATSSDVLSDPTTSRSVATSINGTLAGALTNTPGTCNVSITTQGTENLAVGSGTGGLTCNGAFTTGGSVSFSCTLAYARTGVHVVYNGGCSGPAESASELAAVRIDCVIERFRVTCQVVITF